MSGVQNVTRKFIGAVLIMFLGFFTGEVLSAESAEAVPCSYSICDNSGGCLSSIEANDCDGEQSVCRTKACGEDSGEPTPE